MITRQGKPCYRFKAGNYRRAVMNQLYQNGNLNEKGKDTVKNRIKQICYSRQQPRIEYYKPQVFHCHSNSWRMITTDRWEMPVPVTPYHDCIKPRAEKMIPFPFYFINFTGNQRLPLQSSCYPDPNCILPKQYNGIWKKKGFSEKKIKIILHGFINVKKMHYGVRKHLLGCIDEHHQKDLIGQGALKQALETAGFSTKSFTEKDLWMEMTSSDLFERMGCRIFEDTEGLRCPSPKTGNCPPECTIDIFKTIDQKISKLIRFYEEQFVTLFSQYATNAIGINDDFKAHLCVADSNLNNAIYRVDTGYITPVRLVVNVENKLLKKRMKGVLGGSIYIFENEGRTPVLHLSMLTLYFTDTASVSCGKFRPQGRIYNIRGGANA
jgi:hypothetical protein